MSQSKDERMMSLLDSFLEGRGENATELSELGAVPMDYVSAYLDSPRAEPESPSDTAIRSKTEQLLDIFLSGDNEKPSFSLPLQTGETEPETEDSDDGSDDKEQLDDAYFTETLARIYLKQRRYGKALEIIRSLYLNFPNKSIYFADQIRYLEKLVRINQN
ncbi:MAG: hypothetical protein J6V95_06970 [Bacteroidaceae bacterium]|nr:hypothetical protein [Bacteroidaceae bacterium]